LSCWTFCPKMFSSKDVLSLRIFCPWGHFVPLDVLSTGPLSTVHFVSGCFVSGRFVPSTSCLRTFWKIWNKSCKQLL
jgi:hypothetical protein